MATRSHVAPLVLLLCFNRLGVLADEPKTAQEVVALYVNALGGAEKLAARRSLRLTGTASMPGTGQVRFVQEWKRPGRFRWEMTPPESSARLIHASDGTTWWQVVPLFGGGEPQEMPADLSRLLAEQSDADGPLVDYAQKGHRVELLGREDLEGRPAYRLRVVLRDAAEGESDDYFIDASSGLLVKVKGRRVTGGALTEYERTLSNYKPVDGLLVAHTIRHRSQAHGDGPQTMHIEKAESNIDLPEERFSLAAARAEFASTRKLPPASTPAIHNDPAARALYDRMLAALPAASTLTVTCRHRWESGGMPLGYCTYRLWLKKPNHFRMETTAADGTPAGVIVGDGTNLWIHWPQGRPRFNNEDMPAYLRTRDKVYFSEPAPPGRHSISHRAMLLGAGMAMTIINPSTFHGCTDSLQPHLDAVASRGVERVGEETCDVIEASFMSGQRSWKLWLSQHDHLPRRLREVIHLSHDIVKHEQWTDVVVDGEVADDRFVWQPPADWKQWYLPEAQNELLPPGTPAPDFDAALADGKRVRLSELRGRVVLLVFWRVGCPPCRQELPYLQKLHEKYAARGLVVLGYDASDRLDIITDLLNQQGVTFPCVVDSSPAAARTEFELYRSRAVPTSYLIDRQGRIVSAWVGYDPKSDPAAAHLRNLGLED